MKKLSRAQAYVVEQINNGIAYASKFESATEYATAEIKRWRKDESYRNYYEGKYNGAKEGKFKVIGTNTRTLDALIKMGVIESYTSDGWGDEMVVVDLEKFSAYCNNL